MEVKNADKPTLVFCPCTSVLLTAVFIATAGVTLTIPDK